MNVAATSRARYVLSDVLGWSAAIHEARERAEQAARVDGNVLLTGESGTGKEVFAQAIHTSSARRKGPFVGLNCAALPRELLESELFGYEDGAFTGASPGGRAGKFELAAHGTILLDEIGEMPLGMQAKLLRVLQERVVTRVGGGSERPVTARVIATTHRDLDRLVREGTFRLDLLHRLRVLHIPLPSLRERREDVEPLSLGFLARFARHQGKALLSLGPLLQEELRTHPWPGNVRELANVIEREVSLAPPDLLVLERWSIPLNRPSITPLAEVERRAILDAIVATGDVSLAAAALGVSRTMIYAKLRVWGVDPPRRPPSARMRKVSG